MTKLKQIIFDNYSIGFSEKPLISDASFVIDSGDVVCIFGKNGSGKTTLIRSMLSIIPVISGDIVIDGKSIKQTSQKELAKLLSVVFANRPAIANMNVMDFVTYGRYPYSNWLGLGRDSDEELINKSLERCGLIGLKERFIDSLSDGEMQKVQICRALVQDTPYLLLDEPVSHLDIANKAEIFHLLTKINKNEGKTIVFSSHDLQFALQMATKFMVIDNAKAEILSNEKFLSSRKYEEIMSSDYLDFNPVNQSLKYKST